MKILGDKLFRGSGAAVIKIGSWVLKIPFSMGAIREILQEKNRLSLVKTDEHFSQYLSNYHFFIFFQASRYFEPIFFHLEKDRLMTDYFKKAFKDASSWGMINLKDLTKEYLKFIREYFFDDYDFWNNYLVGKIIPVSSAHGDFFEENILVDKNRLFFIDWSRYNKKSSRYFDLFDYYFFSYKKKGVSWIDCWRRQFDLNQHELFGIDINRNYLEAYGICKVSQELNILKLRGRLDNYKIKKYKNFVQSAKKIILSVHLNED